MPDVARCLGSFPISFAGVTRASERLISAGYRHCLGESRQDSRRLTYFCQVTAFAQQDQHMTRSIKKPIAAITLSMALTSCAGFYAPAEALMSHDNVLVVATATPGAMAGGVAALPIGLTAVFLGGMVGIDPGPADATGLALAPSAFFGQAGAIATGGIPWAIVTVLESEQPAQQSRSE